VDAVTATLIATGSEAEWLEARRHGITASEIAVVLGLSPYGSPFELFHRKTGALPPGQPDSDAMALGRHMESYVAEQFEQRHPEFWVEGEGRTLYAHPVRAWQLATPDRCVYDAHALAHPLAVLECKIDGGSDEWGDDGTDEIPVHYRCQVLWQMDVLGVATGYVACLLWQKRKVRVYEIAMDHQARADLEVMRSGARRFLERIDHGDEPDVDWRPATTGALRALHPSVEDREVVIGRQLAISYRAACRRYKDAERRKDEMTNRVLQQMGGARTAIEAGTGLKLAGRQVYDMKESTRKACTVSKLVPARAPREQP
jgi:putative phage-type endonuclease